MNSRQSSIVLHLQDVIRNLDQLKVRKVELMAELYNSGMTCPEVGEIVGLSSSAVSDAIKASGIIMRRPGLRRGTQMPARRVFSGRDAEIVKLWQDGAVQKDIAKRYGICVQRVSQIVCKADV